MTCDGPYVYSHRGDCSAGRTCVETGAATKESPGWRLGGFFDRSAVGRPQVITAGLRVREESCERGPAHDVRARLGALAVADRDHFFEVGGHLHAAAVVLTPAGLPPHRVRQVCHGSTPSVGRVV